MRNIRKYSQLFLLYGVGLTVIAVFFLNCQKAIHLENQIDESAPASNGAPVTQVEPTPTAGFGSELEAAQAPFAERKFSAVKNSPRGMMQKSASDVVPAGERLIVTIDNECAEEGRGGAVTRAAFTPARRLANIRTQSYLWILPENTTASVLETLIEQDPCVIGTSFDDELKASATPNDPQLSKSLGVSSIGVGASYGFFNNPQVGSRFAVTVAVIDSGINYTHEDLAGVVWKDGSGNYGYNFRSNSNYVFDDFGHGTKVSGVIAAQANNGVGLAGVMGHDIKIMSLKVQDPLGAAYVSDIVAAIDYARANNLPVINISMEGPGLQSTLQSALNAAVTAGIVVVVAAGNDSKLLSTDTVIYPAIYGAGLDGVITVGSIDSVTGSKSLFSNYSSTYVEIMAPGSNGILMTNKNGGYSTDEGTSFAAPMVTGAAALVVSFFKKNGITYTPKLVEDVIMASALKNPSLATYVAQGRVLDLRALAMYLERTYLVPVSGGFNEN